MTGAKTAGGLKPVGLYREMYPNTHAELPALLDSTSDHQVEDQYLVVAYMKAGTPVFDVLGDVTDLLDPTKSIRSGPSLVSDGEWIWRVDSIHYVENYAVEVPAEFLHHVRSRNYRPNSDVDVADPRFDAAIAAYF
ncbi:hypothetical protein [Nocardia sp. CA-145437]|uniref:hypothetical protein n=1 Tax=Nocardia sp. CA-145437 TaxID=3239980 RepID=UPI003D992DA6